METSCAPIPRSSDRKVGSPCCLASTCCWRRLHDDRRVATNMIVAPMDELWPVERTTPHHNSDGLVRIFYSSKSPLLTDRAPLRSMDQFGAKIYHCKLRQCAA